MRIDANLTQLCLNQFEEVYDPTIEDSYRKDITIEKQPHMLDILDTAGEEAYSGLREQWIRDGEGFMLVYSISSRESFDHVEKLHRDVQAIKESAPVMLVANKRDCAERVVSFDEGLALATQLNCGFSEASAKADLNVEKVFSYISQQLRDAKSSQGNANSNAESVRSTKIHRTCSSSIFFEAVKKLFC